MCIVVYYKYNVYICINQLNKTARLSINIEELKKIMETRATEQNILKYLQVLKDLKLILDNTSYLSMLNFSEKHKVTKNLSTVLQKGGIIKLIKKGRYSQWEWTSIEPNKQMAIKTLKELSKLNPPRKKQLKKEKTLFDKPKKSKEKLIDYYEIKMFFGLITFKIKPHFI